MTSCDAVRELLVLHAEGALDAAEGRRVAEHLAACADCRAEADRIGIVRGWLADSNLFEPVQDLTWELLPGKIAARARLPVETKPRWSVLRMPRWASGMAVVLILASGLIWTLRRPAPLPPAIPSAAAAPGNEAFLSKVRTAHARRAADLYLTACRGLLIDLVSSEKKCEGDLYDVSLEVARARQLLQQKRLLDSDLRVSEIERAKGLCDDLEQFLVNVSASQECESRDAVESMERYIEKEQLLLRINLLQSGVS